MSAPEEAGPGAMRIDRWLSAARLFKTRSAAADAVGGGKVHLNDVRVVCGGLIILGLLTRLAAIPLIIIMIVAIVSTKIPILLGHDFWIFHVPKLPRYGLWSAAHEARADFSMLLGALYLLIEGAGAWSVDARLARKSVSPNPPKE